MLFLLQLALCLTIATNAVVVKSSLDEYLHSLLTSYEVLHPAKIISKRGLDDDITQHLHFTAFNQTFNLVLHRTYSGTASSSLTIQAVHSGGTVRTVGAADLLSDFYSGYIEGQPNSYVYGYKEDNKFYFTVDDGIQQLNVEPLSRMSRNQSDSRLLAYYDDAINSTGHFCGSQSTESGASVRTTPAPPAYFDVLAATAARRRNRRQSGPTESADQSPKSVCRMQLVADHTFVERIASGSFGSTAKCLIKIADDINKLYMETRFVHPTTGEVYTGVGFELANVRVLESPSMDSGPPWAPHFNAPLLPGAPPQQASQYLEAFGDYAQNGLDLAAYCINHLVTFRPMQQNILGLAYLGSSHLSNIGGVCSPPSVSNHGRQRMIGRNIGMATYANKDGQPILSRQALLVSAHELGHNMGSEHDPATQNVCSPSWSDGGPYLMYQIAVTGNVPHHNQFSECSSKQMAMVIKARQSSCFHAPRNKLCGNHRREGDEDCDPGPVEDRCCSTDCKLKLGAVCSDANSPCCSRCRHANNGTLCQRQLPLHPCQQNTYCSGFSDTCPKPADLPNGTACQSGVGVCLSGQCKSICSSLGPDYEPCACDTDAHACEVCCQVKNSTGTCGVYRQPETGRTVLMPANQPCRGGRCLANGTCQELRLGSGQLIVRLWDLIVQSGSNSLATFLWKNIVLTVLLLSLLLWVPACAIIAYQDRLDAEKVISLESDAAAGQSASSQKKASRARDAYL